MILRMRFVVAVLSVVVVMSAGAGAQVWYNPRDFVAPPANTYGDSGRGILYGPGHVNFDTSLSKRVTVVGRANVEFRWDAFNLFNHPGFGFPNQNFDSPTAGRITSTAVDNRSMQFSIKFNF